jgi:septal ring-binding cell division protein DamX
MEITIKTIRGVAVSHLLVLGLAACSSSPAPWTQTDESPWGTKRAAESQNVPADEAVTDTTLNDPVLLADPAAEPITMQEPEAAPAPEAIVAVVVEDLTPEQEIMAMPATDYAVQVYASKTADSVEKFITDKGLNGMKMVKTDRSGSIVYVLVDVYPDRATASAAAVELETKIGAKPWVRSLAGLQKIVAQ